MCFRFWVRIEILEFRGSIIFFIIYLGIYVRFYFFIYRERVV